VQPSSHLTSCTPLTFWDLPHFPERTCPIHTSNIPSNKSYINFFSLRSFIHRIGPGFLWSFVTSIYILRLGVVSPTSNPQAGAPLLVGYPQMLIQYIRIYPPYLEVVSFIRNLRTRHAVVTDPPNMAEPTYTDLNPKARMIRNGCSRMNGKYQRTTNVNFFIHISEFLRWTNTSSV
jgi:hypothetical protein